MAFNKTLFYFKIYHNKSVLFIHVITGDYEENLEIQRLQTYFIIKTLKQSDTVEKKFSFQRWWIGRWWQNTRKTLRHQFSFKLREGNGNPTTHAIYERTICYIMVSLRSDKTFFCYYFTYPWVALHIRKTQD